MLHLVWKVPFVLHERQSSTATIDWLQYIKYVHLYASGVTQEYWTAQKIWNTKKSTCTSHSLWSQVCVCVCKIHPGDYYWRSSGSNWSLQCCTRSWAQIHNLQSCKRHKQIVYYLWNVVSVQYYFSTILVINESLRWFTVQVLPLKPH